MLRDTLLSLHCSKLTYLLSLCLFVFDCVDSYGQKAPDQQAVPGYNHWTQYAVEEGLISSEVHCLLQDRDGYLWIGTDQGLCSFDSEEWTYYTPADGLQDGLLVELKEDAIGNIWFKGLNHTIGYVDKRSNEVKTPTFNQTLMLHLNHRHALKWNIDHEGNGYVYVHEFHNNRIKRPYALTMHQIGQFEVLDTLRIGPSKYQFLHKKTQPEEVWIYDRTTTRLSIESCAGDYNEFYGIQTGLNLPGMASNGSLRDLPNLTTLPGNKLLVGINNYIMIVDQASGNVLSADTLEHDVAACRVGADGKVWIGLKHRGGLLVYPSSDLSKQPKSFLKGLTISSFCDDSSGALWIGTTERGIFYFSNSAFYKIPFPVDGEKLTALSTVGQQIHAIFGRKNGYRLNTKNGYPSFEYLHSGKQLSNIWCIGDTCFTSEVHVDNRIRLMRWTMEPTVDTTWCSGTAFTHSLPISDDEIFAYSNIQWGFINYNNGELNAISLDNGTFLRVNSAIKWDQDTVLIASNRGLKKVTIDGQQEFMADEIGMGHIYDIAIDPWNNFWIATKGHGVYYANRKGQVLCQYTTDHGLPRNASYDLELTTDSQLFGATPAGLFQIDVSRKKRGRHEIQTWGVAQGLHSLDLKQLASNEDYLFLNVANGPVMAPLKSLRKGSKYPALRIKKVTINGEHRTLDQIAHLGAHENDVSIQFGGFHFGSKKPIYWYSLDHGFSWKSTHDQELNLLDINPGSYHVMIATRPVFRQGKDLQLAFEIAQPFTKSPLFIVLIFLVGGAFAFFILWTFLSRERLERRILMSRQQALSSQMNPHFIFNALNSIYYFVGKGKKGEVQSYISEFAFLMRQVLNASRKGQITLDKELEALRAYLELEELRFRMPHEIRVVVADDLKPRLSSIKIPSMILQPYLENAVEHGLFPKDEPGYLLFELSATTHELSIIIEDNGVGREHSKKLPNTDYEPSHGMAITEERIALVNKKSSRKISYKVEDLLPSGTRVSICIPI